MGKSMKFREDMYALLFVASVKDEYKETCDKEKKTKDAKMDLLY